MCPDGWGVYGSSCYKYFGWAVDWYFAQSYCVSQSNSLDCSYLLKNRSLFFPILIGWELMLSPK